MLVGPAPLFYLQVLPAVPASPSFLVVRVQADAASVGWGQLHEHADCSMDQNGLTNTRASANPRLLPTCPPAPLSWPPHAALARRIHSTLCIFSLPCLLLPLLPLPLVVFSPNNPPPLPQRDDHHPPGDLVLHVGDGLPRRAPPLPILPVPPAPQGPLTPQEPPAEDIPVPHGARPRRLRTARRTATNPPPPCRRCLPSITRGAPSAGRERESLDLLDPAAAGWFRAELEPSAESRRACPA